MPHGQSLPALISLSVWFMMNLSGAMQKSLVPCGGTRRSTVGAGRALSCPPPAHHHPTTPTHHRRRRVQGHGSPAEDEGEEPTAQHPAGRGVSGAARPRGGTQRPAPRHSHGEEAAGALGQPQAGQQADGEDEDEEEEVGQPPGRRGRAPSAGSPPPAPREGKGCSGWGLTGNTPRRRRGRPAR